MSGALARTLRDMRAADLDEVLAIEQQAHAHPWTLGMFRDALDYGYLCKVLLSGERIIGYAVLMPALDEVHLLDISIAPDCQQQGIGTKLLNIIKELCVNGKYERIILEVRSSNLAAKALYRKAGFTQIGLRRDYYPANDGREDALVMEYKLK